MPTILGTDDFNHAIDAGYYTDGFESYGGYPIAVTAPYFMAQPKSLQISSGSNPISCRHNISGSQTRVWAGFPFRTPAKPSQFPFNTPIFTFKCVDPGAQTGSIYIEPFGLYVTAGSISSSPFTISTNTWYWVEAIYDVSGSTHTIYLKVNGTSAGQATLSSSATTVSHCQLESGSLGNYTSYYGTWQYGYASSASDWLGFPFEKTITFPSTAIIDAFNRTNETPLASPWIKTISGDNNINLSSNQLSHATGSGNGASFYLNNQTFNPQITPFELYTCVAARGANEDCGLDYCLHDVGGSGILDGYRFQSLDSVLQLYRITDGSFTKIGGDWSINLASGDWLGVRVIGNSHILFHRTMYGCWTQVATVSDSTHTGTSGYVGLFIEASSTLRLDDFGGGALPTYGSYVRIGSAS